VQFNKPIIEFPAVYEMLTKMRIDVQATRSLLYETSRFVDVYKNYQQISEERKLEKEERQEMKTYLRLADIFTPLLKFYSSEYCNRIAYDALQIHGGAGYMKDFPVERIYRDARITTIYEGTSQLQVVAAIRGVTTKAYLKKIREYQELDYLPEVDYVVRRLTEMTDEYEKVLDRILEVNETEYTDFHARRLVEMTGNIIMSYLLLQDGMRHEKFIESAELFSRKAEAENRENATFIQQFQLKDLGVYKY
jgi:hypothetical protein